MTSTRLQQPVQMDFQIYPSWENQADGPWRSHDDVSASNYGPPIYSSSVEDGFWMGGIFDLRAQLGAAAMVPSSPSDIPDDVALTPLTPLATSPTFDGPSLFGSLPMDFNTVGLGMPAYQASHDDMPMFSLAPPQLPSTPPSSVPLPDFDISPHEPHGPYPIRIIDAKRARIRRRITTPKIYKCDVEGCTISFTSSRRDIERHKASVHGPPVVLDCGESLSYRPDNIARHRKKCEVCSAAHMRKCEEDGGELKLRPGRKRKLALDSLFDE